jgi:hypothetical protein
MSAGKLVRCSLVNGGHNGKKLTRLPFAGGEAVSSMLDIVKEG